MKMYIDNIEYHSTSSMINHDRKRDLLAAPRSGSEAAGKHESRIRIE